MNIYSHSGLDEALQQTLADIDEYGVSSSPRGRASKELLGYNFIIDNPRDRLVGFKVRDLNPFYLVGNLLWVLSQSNDLDFITYYNPKGVNFSDDGKILRGAYGKRVFDFDGVNQWNQVVKELKLDPYSRRAIITFHLPQHDWSGSLDTPCTANIQFFIRDGKLNMINHMRSQSAAFVMPYDVFLMTMLQEIMANELNVELGYYHHFCGSIHYFENEQEMVNNIIDAEDFTNQMYKMPKINFKSLLIFEKELRETAKLALNVQRVINESYFIDKLHSLNLGEYWNNIGYILIAKALQYTGSEHYEGFIEGIEQPFDIFFK